MLAANGNSVFCWLKSAYPPVNLSNRWRKHFLDILLHFELVCLVSLLSGSFSSGSKPLISSGGLAEWSIGYGKHISSVSIAFIIIWTCGQLPKKPIKFEFFSMISWLVSWLQFVWRFGSSICVFSALCVVFHFFSCLILFVLVEYYNSRFSMRSSGTSGSSSLAPFCLFSSPYDTEVMTTLST